MSVIVTGSISYDRIMDYPDRFKNHILPDKVHMLSVSFIIETLDERFGGTAGNIAHNLKLIGIEPWVVGAVGDDFERYARYFEGRGISTEWIKRIEHERTSVAHMITDLDDNQISAFYPGALKYATTIDIPKELAKQAAFFVVAPSSKGEMVKRCMEAKRYGISYLFDPGQQMTALSPEELSECVIAAALVIFNDYEWQLFQSKTGLALADLTARGIVVAVTEGHQGSTIHTRERAYRIGVAKPAGVVDPTGAGDAYRAGVVAGFLNTWDWQVAGQAAATIASFAVERHGTQEHRPTQEALGERYRKNFKDENPFEHPLKSIITEDTFRF